MDYRILVFNYHSIKGFDKSALRMFLLGVNFDTLCVQYHLDPAQIPSTKTNLEVVVSRGGDMTYFLVNYRGEHHRPIVVNEWDVDEGRGKRMKENLLQKLDDEKIGSFISKSSFIVEIELSQTQLQEMGLLLAYEIARWGAKRGEGVILGLDQTWYRLNQHQAFVPINEEKS